MEQCSCKMTTVGAFGGSWVAYLAICSPALFGQQFLLLLMKFAIHPSEPPIILMVWFLLVSVSGWLLFVGIRDNLRDGHSTSTPGAVLTVVICLFGLGYGLYPHGDPILEVLSRGIWISVLAAASTRLVMVIAMVVWDCGYKARGREEGDEYSVSVRHGHETEIHRLQRDNSALRQQLLMLSDGRGAAMPVIEYDVSFYDSVRRS